MACNKDLLADGKKYPRTCADCGKFNPCKKYSGTSLYDLTPLNPVEFGDFKSMGVCLDISSELSLARRLVERGEAKAAAKHMLKAAEMLQAGVARHG